MTMVSRREMQFSRPRGRPLGLAGCRGTHLELLYVEPEVHGTGIGTLLLDHVAPTSVEVYAGNAHGLGFYTSHGFRTLRTHTTDIAGNVHAHVLSATPPIEVYAPFGIGADAYDSIRLEVGVTCPGDDPTAHP